MLKDYSFNLNITMCSYRQLEDSQFNKYWPVKVSVDTLWVEIVISQIKIIPLLIQPSPIQK